MVDTKRLVRNLTAFCFVNDISNARLKELTGISSATVSQWRNGQYQPSDKSLKAIEKLVGMPIDDFVAIRTFEVGNNHEPKMNPPTVTEDTTTFPVLGEIAAHYDCLALESWTGDSIEIPNSYLRGRSPKDYFVLQVRGDSMYPDYQDGDHILVLRQSTMNRSGEVGVVIYNDDAATLKRVEYVMGEDWMTLRPINPQFPPITIRDEELEHCKVLGVAKMVIREVQ